MAKKTKSLADIKADMSTLYDEVREGKVERADAAELANIAGKWLKADQLEFARAVFDDHLRKRAETIPIESVWKSPAITTE